MQVRPGRSYFNPRLREGGDPKRYLSHIFFPISIHASAREATDNVGVFLHFQRFQSTPPRGRRPTLWRISVSSTKFQSTPPRGRRQLLCCDFGFFHQISIHASAREATDCEICCLRSDTISIHASAREATPACGICQGSCAHFNPRLREGGDKSGTLVVPISSISIHASAREAT